MIKKYTLKRFNKKYIIIENNTTQLIKQCCNNSDASKLLRHLNSGGGFNGITPTFFLRTWKCLLWL